MRLFIAADTNDEQKKKLTEVQNSLKIHINNVRWVRTSALHITLKFLGEVKGPIEEVVNLLKYAVHNFRPFNFSLDGLGVFPHFRRPHIIWVGIGQGNDELSKLNREIDRVLWKTVLMVPRRRFLCLMLQSDVFVPPGRRYCHTHTESDR